MQNTIAIQGIQYDKKSSYLRGPAQAPSLIRKSFHSGSSNYYSELGVLVQNQNILDKGDFDIQNYTDIEKITLEHLQKGHRLLTLGGDHSISYPLLKTYNQFYKNIQILHIDAHADLYHEFEGDLYSHACPFARIMEGKHATRLIQMGIRTLNPHQRAQAQKYGVEVQEMKDWDSSIIRFSSQPLYVSLDMDVFDPAYAPGVSHHEPGGATARQVIDLIHRIDVPIIGADIVEYNPTRDIQDITAALAAKMMKEILGKML